MIQAALSKDLQEAIDFHKAVLAEGSAPGEGRGRDAASKEAPWCRDLALPAPDRGGADPGGRPPLEPRGIIHHVREEHRRARQDAAP